MQISYLQLCTHFKPALTYLLLIKLKDDVCSFTPMWWGQGSKYRIKVWMLNICKKHIQTNQLGSITDNLLSLQRTLNAGSKHIITFSFWTQPFFQHYIRDMVVGTKVLCCVRLTNASRCVHSVWVDHDTLLTRLCLNYIKA